MQKLNKFNQFLLEKYPTIWNTKIVWMLLAALAAHIIFFVIGYLSHIDPISLQKYSVKNDYKDFIRISKIFVVTMKINLAKACECCNALNKRKSTI